MNRQTGQMLALGAVFQAAILADQVARTGQAQPEALRCLLASLLVRNPENTEAVYAHEHLNTLQDGYRLLQGTLERNSRVLQLPALKYGLAILSLERRLARNPAMLEQIGQRLDQIQLQAGHFGIAHDNVIAAFGGLYQDTLSTFRQRIQIHGEMNYLQQADKAALIRALLLAGIRAARLWRQLGGHRWQLVFRRTRLLAALQPLLHPPG